MPTFGTVGGIATSEGPTADDTDKSTSFGHPNAINKLPCFKQICPQNITGFNILREVPKLLNAPNWHAGMFFDVTQKRLREALFLLVIESQLNGVIAIFLGCLLNLQHVIRTNLNHGYRGSLP